MKTTETKIIIQLLLLLLFIVVTACISRTDDPTIGGDASIIYPSKQTDAILAKISFCRRIDNETGELSDEGLIFLMIENGILYVVADIENQNKHLQNGLMPHIDLIGSNGKSFFFNKLKFPQGIPPHP